MTERDYSLDVIRGVACLLMIMAHVVSWGMTTDASRLAIITWKLGFFAWPLFFFALGPSVVYQRERSGRLKTAVSYAGLMLFSFTWEGMRASDNYYLHLTSNLLLCLGIAALVCLAFTRLLRGRGIAPRAIPLVLAPLALLAAIVAVSRTVLASKSYSAGLAGQSGYLLPGVTAALLGAYLLGRRRVTIVAACVALAAVGACLAAGLRLPSEEGTNPLYVSGGLAACCITMLVSPLLTHAWWLTRLLTFLGRRSLLFFFVHYLVILVMPALPYASLAWVVCLAITVVLMLLLSLANPWLVRWHVPASPWFWLALLIAEVLPALLHAPNMAQRGMMCAVGVLFALNHARFRDCAMRLLRRS